MSAFEAAVLGATEANTIIFTYLIRENLHVVYRSYMSIMCIPSAEAFAPVRYGLTRDQCAYEIKTIEHTLVGFMRYAILSYLRHQAKSSRHTYNWCTSLNPLTPPSLIV
jgi:hypothetical protein